MPGLAGGIAGGIAGGAIANRPGVGDAGDRWANRPTTPEGRRDQLQDRLANSDRGPGNRGDRQDNRQENRGDRQDNRQGNRGDRQDNRQDNRGDRQDNRQDYRDDRRDDWQQNWNDNNWYHNDWCHGHWNNGWWDHMWDNHPAAMAFGLTSWGVNRLAYTFGYWGYSNPYYIAPVDTGTVVYDYSQPLVSYDDSAAYAAAPATTDATAAAEPPPEALPPGVTQEALDSFNAARDAFYKGDYGQALDLVDKTLKQMPKDASTHEFRALVLFATGRFQEAASTIYAVLSVGPGWDWTTMSSMYPDVDTYTGQLRTLESFTKSNADSSPAHFLLAYHYITAGHKDAAAKQLKSVVELTPDNSVAKDLLIGIGGPDAVPQSTSPAPPESSGPAPTGAELVGNWTAKSKDAKFEMKLTDDGKFTWAYDQNGKRQEVKGVYAIDGKTLAMEPDSGGTMLADLSLEGKDSLQFQMVGGPPGDPGLKFSR
ncbi:MAG: tetratricopeptide repeat protein [Planctomycetaceae bacterium]